MKKNLIIAVGVLLSCINSLATTVVLNTTTFTPGNGGGEFAAYMSDPSFLSYYASAAITTGAGSWNGVNAGLDTFCLETGVEFTPGNWGGPTYTTTLGASTGATPNNAAGSSQALSVGTAFLYYEFASGGLAGYNYLNQSARISDNLLLQEAIWALQGNQTYGNALPSSDITNPNYNSYLALVINDFGSGAYAGYLGKDVSVLQLTDSNGNSVQNQLILTGNQWSVPDNGDTIWLLCGSLFLVGCLKQYLQKTFFLNA